MGRASLGSWNRLAHTRPLVGSLPSFTITLFSCATVIYTCVLLSAENMEKRGGTPASVNYIKLGEDELAGLLNN